MKKTLRRQENVNNVVLTVDDIGQDLLQNILGRLPALSFASAACVSQSWNILCNRILSFPKLSSAVSFNPSLEDAVDEVVDKVFAEPIRPHFALVSLLPPYINLPAAHQLITEKLASMIPVITNVSEGIIGRDVLTDKHVEVQWEETMDEDLEEESHLGNVNRGLLLTVGFLPGLKAHVIPLLLQCEARLLIDEFVMDIRDYASAVSDSASPASPAGIILFLRDVHIKPVLQAMDYAFPSDTVIVGDMGSHILYRGNSRNNTTERPNSVSVAVALVFARDRNKPLGIAETQFDAIISTGVTQMGPLYRALSVECDSTSTMLTASRVTFHRHLDGQAILEEIYEEQDGQDILLEIYEELGDRIQYPTFYIGVTKSRRCSDGTEKEFQEFHKVNVNGEDEECLIVNSDGIKTGDLFCFYASDSKAALSSCDKVSDYFRSLKQDCAKQKVFGGIIFTCRGRGDSFFGRPNIDSSPFLENFPGVPFGGTYCTGEIGRGNLSLYEEGNEEVVHIRSCQHVYSAIYLVMSYSPPPEDCQM